MSIKDHALLVSVTINQPKKTKSDRSAAEKAAADASANASAVRVVHDLYPKHLIQPIEQIASRARALAANPRYTYPWGRNQELLPTERAMEFMSEAGKLELEFEQAVTAFMNNYVNVISDAQTELGKMFDASCYPDVSDLRRQFKMKFYYDQITDSRDWRVKTSEEVGEMLMREKEQEFADKYSGLAAAPLSALHAQMTHLYDILTADPTPVHDDTGALKDLKYATFKNSSVDKIIVECEKIIAFGDTVLPSETVSLAGRIKQSLPSGDRIRKSLTTRGQAATVLREWVQECEAMLDINDATIDEQTLDLNPMGLDEPPEQLVLPDDLFDDAHVPVDNEPVEQTPDTADLDDLFTEDF